MKYIEMSIEDAMKRCKKNAKILVAVQDLEDENMDVVFISKRRNEYDKLFEDVKTVAGFYNDLVKQLALFTEKQDIENIRPYGIQKTVLLKEWYFCNWNKIPNKSSKKILTNKNISSIIVFGEI